MNISTFRLQEALLEKEKQEDGTAADLGPAPTGHKKDDNVHSLCIHDIDEENDWDDGW